MKIAVGSIQSENEITIKLSTLCAIRLFNGREKTIKRHGIMGLPGFSKHLNTIERAIKSDDPYADHHFIIIEEAIENLKNDFETINKDMEVFIQNNTPSMDLSKSVSSDPLIIPIRFASRTTFKLLFQIIKADEIVLKVLQANHIGLLANDEKFKMIAHIEKNVRSVIYKVFDYKFTGVTRDDLAANNKRAILAHAQMGELNNAVMDGTLRSPEAPQLPKRREEHVKALDVKETVLDENKAPEESLIEATETVTV